MTWHKNYIVYDANIGKYIYIANDIIKKVSKNLFGDNYVKTFHLNLFPDVFLDIWLISQVVVKFFPVLEVHYKDGSFHFPIIIQKASGANDVSAQPGHSFKVTGTHSHSLF